jgi:hypothetical protein
LTERLCVLVLLAVHALVITGTLSFLVRWQGGAAAADNTSSGAAFLTALTVAAFAAFGHRQLQGLAQRHVLIVGTWGRCIALD